MLVADEKNELNQEYLNTAKLRELEIITEQGRVKE
jgi:hypothetical protein